MNIDQLKQLISKGESDQLEFKKSTGQLKPIFETFCGFLNSSGGTILIGVTDSGRIVGQQVSDKTRQELARELSKIEPKANPQIYYIDVGNDKQVIAIETAADNHIPYVYNSRPYERNQSVTEYMSQHRYEQLIIQRSHLNHNWEEFLTDEFTIDDLDHVEIRNTIKDGIETNRISPESISFSIEQILKNFKLLKNGKLINAAVALFAKDSEKIFNRCEIKMARFRGRDKLEGFIDNQLERGNIFQLIKFANHFALRHLPIASSFEPGRLDRIDQPAVPQLALREALINAFCHRDYNIRSATTSLAIYDDRLEIWSPGGLLPELKIEQLKAPHDSHQRNELIANVFYKRGWIEKWGTGTTRMVEYCQKNKTPEPEFSEEGGGFSVVFNFKEVMHTSISTSETTTLELTLRQKEIIKILDTFGEMSLNQIREHLHQPIPISTLRKYLGNLKSQGLLASKGQARSTTWLLIKK